MDKSIKKYLKRFFSRRSRQSSNRISSRIEKANLPDEDVKKVTRSLPGQELTGKDKQEVQEHFESFKNVFNTLESAKLSEMPSEHFHEDFSKSAAEDRLIDGEYEESESRIRFSRPRERVARFLSDDAPNYLTPGKRRIRKRARRKINAADVGIAAGAILISFCMVSISGYIQESQARKLNGPPDLTHSVFRLANAFDLYNQKRF